VNGMPKTLVSWFLFNLYSTDLQFRYLAYRVELRTCQHIGGGFSVMERYKNQAFRSLFRDQSL